MIGWSRRNVFLGVAIFVIVLILSQLSSSYEEVDGELLDALREAEVATRIKDHLGDSALVDNLLDEAEASGSSGDEILRKMLDEIEAADRDEREEIIQSILVLLDTVATVESANLQVAPLRSDGLICVGMSRVDVLDIQGTPNSMSAFETVDFQTVDEKWWYSRVGEPERWISFDDNKGNVNGCSGSGEGLSVAANLLPCQ